MWCDYIYAYKDECNARKKNPSEVGWWREERERERGLLLWATGVGRGGGSWIELTSAAATGECSPGSQCRNDTSPPCCRIYAQAPTSPPLTSAIQHWPKLLPSLVYTPLVSIARSLGLPLTLHARAAYTSIHTDINLSNAPGSEWAYPLDGGAEKYGRKINICNDCQLRWLNDI